MPQVVRFRKGRVGCNARAGEDPRHPERGNARSQDDRRCGRRGVRHGSCRLPSAWDQPILPTVHEGREPDRATALTPQAENQKLLPPSQAHSFRRLTRDTLAYLSGTVLSRLVLFIMLPVPDRLVQQLATGTALLGVYATLVWPTVLHDREREMIGSLLHSPRDFAKLLAGN